MDKNIVTHFSYRRCCISDMYFYKIGQYCVIVRHLSPPSTSFSNVALVSGKANQSQTPSPLHAILTEGLLCVRCT